MPPENLMRTFRVDDLQQAELESLLGHHFTHSKALSLEEVIYPADETHFALKLRYNRKGRISEISAGPGLDTSLREKLRQRIEDELLTPRGMRVGRVVLFANTRCQGFFRYRDILQILPVPREAPQPPQTMGEHPFVLEFQFAESSNYSISTARRFIREHKHELLIAALLPYSIRSLGKMLRHHWVWPAWDIRNGVAPRSSYQQEGYTWEGLSLLVDAFTEPEGMTPLQSKEPVKFYTRRGVSADDKLELPSNIDVLLNQFFALDTEQQERFLRASFLAQHARIVYTYSRSAAFTALISAIETLIPQESLERCDRCNGLLTTERCEACGRTLERTTQRFSEFVERFATISSISASNRGRLYAIRSRLSHGDSLLPSDERIWQTGLTRPWLEEWEDIGTAWGIVTVILANWLQAQRD